MSDDGRLTRQELADILMGSITSLAEANAAGMDDEEREDALECAADDASRLPDEEISGVSFEQAGILTSDAGFVLKIGDRTFHVKVLEA